MPKLKRPTIRQKAVMNELLMAVKNGEPCDMKTAMIKSGYSPKTALNPGKNLTSKPQWQELLAQIDNQEILNVFYKIMTDQDEDGKVKDKDAAIKAGKELATLKDLYPAQKSKIIGLFDKISALEE